MQRRGLFVVNESTIDQNGLPCTPYQLMNNSKPNVRHYHVFGCPAIFKRYEISDSGKRIKNKYIQQGIRGIFVGFPEDSSGWLSYVPSARKTYISLDAVFDEEGTSEIKVSRISVANKKAILKELDLLNINESTVFPYIESSAKYVADKFKFNKSIQPTAKSGG